MRSIRNGYKTGGRTDIDQLGENTQGITGIPRVQWRKQHIDDALAAQSYPTWWSSSCVVS